MYPHVLKRPSGVVRGIGMTQDVEKRWLVILCVSPLIPFLKFVIPSTKKLKTNVVLVSGGFATLRNVLFSKSLRNLSITEKIFS
jgi:hypothetical protein